MRENGIEFEAYLHYKETERFLDSLVAAKPMPHFVASKHAVTRKNPFGLERIASFLNALGQPHLRNKYIHVAGTSGKTSTTYFTANLFQSQGYKTGMFTSPHIATFAEYFTIDRQLPPVQDILALVEQVKPLIDREYETKNMGVISYAELILALAFIYFARQNVDYVTLEAFLGGRYDATNVIEQAEVSIITNIGLDHTHILGDTLPEIAADKVGIVKVGCPLLTAETKPEILEIFRQATHKFETDLQVLGQEFRIEHVRPGDHSTVFDYVSDRHSYRELHTAMCGAYQAENAALAIRAIELVSAKQSKPLDENTLRKGMRGTFIPGRYETINTDPVVILDGAHNPDKIAQLVAYLKSQFQEHEVIIICGFTTGRHPEAMLKSLLEVSNTFYLTRVIIGYREEEEPLYLKSVLTSLCPAVKAVIKLDPFAAIVLAMDEAAKHGNVVCVTGSLYLVAYLRQRWYPEYQVLRYE
jgi:dihydrofolate synthase/folylpolyglutamate synthase